MKTHYIAPLFSGEIDTQEQQALLAVQGFCAHQNYEMLINDVNCYPNTLAHLRPDHSALVQNIARACAAAVLARDVLRYQRGDVRLIAVDGRPWQVARKTFKGAELMEAVWQYALPPYVMRGMPDPVISTMASCTVQEVREVFKQGTPIDDYTFVTHAHHVPRVERVASREAAGRCFEVQTPACIVHCAAQMDEACCFAHRVVEASEPRGYECARAEMVEMLLSVFDAFSHCVQRFTRGRCNPEIALAEWHRKRREKRAMDDHRAGTHP